MLDMFDNLSSWKAATIVAAFLGSVVSLSYIPELTILRLAQSLLAGTTVSIYAVPLVSHVAPIPTPLEGPIAFFLGLFAMRLVPMVFHWIDRYKSARLPHVPDDKV